MHPSIGKTFSDKITGFKGVCTGRIEYITGCNQLLLSPKVGDDGAAKEASWFDEQRCIEANVTKITLDNAKSPGHGPIPAGTRRG